MWPTSPRRRCQLFRETEERAQPLCPPPLGAIPLLKAQQDRHWHVYLLAVGFPPLWHAWKVLSGTFSHAGAGKLAAQGELFLHRDGLCCWEPPSTGPAREEHLLSRCRGGFPKLLSWARASTGVLLAPRPREASCSSRMAVRCCEGTRQP